jgi:hypothetical protein
MRLHALSRLRSKNRPDVDVNEIVVRPSLSRKSSFSISDRISHWRRDLKVRNRDVQNYCGLQGRMAEIPWGGKRIGRYYTPFRSLRSRAALKPSRLRHIWPEMFRLERPYCESQANAYETTVGGAKSRVLLRGVVQASKANAPHRGIGRLLDLSS